MISVKPEFMIEDDDSVTATIDELGIAVNAQSKDEAIRELVSDIKIYAEDYNSCLELYINSPNLSQHFPFIQRVLLCKNDDEIKALLNL